ncbi:unnamed protein product (macronuclear) [Paramecium tetraurelia]|uniref:RING-type domain-containing protein n=1 Tax=Paramecium tetraurelia TaxID=5888 RepID=A0DVX9_PARTE|nr:uncharacterized protein GSPATT00020849001 [Paramecium tetraurelia]CAK87196.1 unnamed protein product [Paramecium tetraurelia]|eukprot:XP_001454593.1 hypothetical protein (macronuclear) [Paramecium tetraurelia strain d4-2]
MLFLIIFTLLINVLALVNLTIDEQFSETETALKLLQSQYQVNQTVRNAAFYFQPFQVDQDKYLTVELTFLFPYDGDVDLEFSITKNKDDNTSSDIDIFYDLNAQYLRKQYQIIQINPFTFDKNDKFYIDVKIKETNFKDYLYLLKITKTSNKICPNYCGNSLLGQCDTENGICSCFSEYVDLDCSKKASQLTMKEPLQNIKIQKQEYFYFQRDQLNSNITLNFGLMNSQYETSGVEIFIMYENFELGVPCEQFSNYNFSLKNKSSHSEVIDLAPLIFDENLQRYQRLLITISAQYSALIYLQASISTSESNFDIDSSLIIVYVLVSIAIVLLLTWIIVIVIRYRRSSRVQNVGYNVSHPQNNNNRRNLSSLTANLVDHYMPKLKYFQILEFPDFQDLDIQETCSVCLLEYQKQAICRFTPCHHIFHADCLEQWIMKHENCPLCRTALDYKTLKELLNQNNLTAFKQHLQKEKLKKNNIVIQSHLFSNAQTELRMIHNQAENP